MKKENYKKYILAIVIAIVVIALVGLSYWQLMLNRTTVETTSLSTGWTCSFNGQILESKGDGNIGDYTFSNLERGDVVTFESTLPDETEENDLVSVLFHYVVVDVYVDDELVYSYGHDSYDNGWLVGNGYHYVSMPQNAGGKQMRIVLTVAEDNAFTNVAAPTIGDATAIYQEFISDNMFGTSVGIFLLILGMVLIVISCVSSVFEKSFRQLVYIGLFSFSMSLWYLCDIKIFGLIGVDLSAMATVKYFALYFAPIPFILIVMTMIVGKPGPRMRFLRVYAGVMSAFLVVTTCLNYLNIVHYTQFLTYFHILVGLGMIVLIIVHIFAEKRSNNKKVELEQSSIIILLGLCAFIVCAIMEIVRYNLQQYVLRDNDEFVSSVIPLGLLIMVLSFVLSYILRTYDIFVANAQKGLLETLAYTDMLCKVSNRAKYNEDITEIMNSKQEYAFVNMDVDGLKKVNDNMGHGMGDELLTEFSDILKQAFYNVGNVYRMGGDEFLVIIKGEKLDDLNAAINQMNDLAQKRSADLPFTIEFSYGIAKSSESLGDTPELLYSLADKRMYTMKNQRKMRKRMR